MNQTLNKVSSCFRASKLNLNPSKTRYMLFNLSTLKTELIQINNEYIERVWSKGDEKSFKLVGIYLDEKLKWDEHISQIAKKIGYSNYSLNKARNNLTQKAKNYCTVG